MSLQRWLLSAITIAWLALRFDVAVDLDRDSWPVMESSMFWWSTTEVRKFRLGGVTGDGSRVEMPARGFGLQENQLNLWLQRRLEGLTGVAGPRALASLARNWNADHPRRQVIAVDLLLERIQLSGDAPRSTTRILRWTKR